MLRYFLMLVAYIKCVLLWTSALTALSCGFDRTQGPILLADIS